MPELGPRFNLNSEAAADAEQYQQQPEMTRSFKGGSTRSGLVRGGLTSVGVVLVMSQGLGGDISGFLVPTRTAFAWVCEPGFEDNEQNRKDGHCGEENPPNPTQTPKATNTPVPPTNTAKPTATKVPATNTPLPTATTKPESNNTATAVPVASPPEATPIVPPPVATTPPENGQPGSPETPATVTSGPPAEEHHGGPPPRPTPTLFIPTEALICESTEKPQKEIPLMASPENPDELNLFALGRITGYFQGPEHETAQEFYDRQFADIPQDERGPLVLIWQTEISKRLTICMRPPTATPRPIVIVTPTWTTTLPPTLTETATPPPTAIATPTVTSSPTPRGTLTVPAPQQVP